MKKMSLVRVDWVDSVTHGGWRDLGSVKDYNHCPAVSVGYLAKKDRDVLVIAPHVSSGTDEGCGLMTIPRCSVKKITKLD